MAFEYGINAKLNVDGALANVKRLIEKLDAAEEKASGLKVNVSINNELVSQLKSLKDIANAQKDVTTSATKQAQEEQKLAALEEKTAGIKQKNAQQEKLAEEQLNQAKAKTAAQEKKNVADAATAEQKLAAQKKSDADAELQRAQKLRTEEQKTATEAAKTANEVKKGQDAAAAAAQNRMNAQRKADIDAANAASRYTENVARGEERIQQEKQRTAQMEINTAAAILSLIDRKDRVEYNAEQRRQRAADAEWRRQQRIQKEQKENDDAIARDLEKQARIEKAQAQIEEQKSAKTKELRAAIEANQKAQEDYNRVLAKALPTVNEIRRAMQNLNLSQENLKTAYYRANSPLSFMIGKVGPEGTWTHGLQRIGGGLSKAGEVLQGATQAYQAVQEVAENTTSSIWGVARSFFNQVTNGFSNLTQEGLEAFGTLEMAEIGFANFFDGSATEFTQKIKEKAVEMPMVGAADLARSVQYIAPLAGGDSDLALSAVEGVMKSIVYSGNDVSQYGTKALQNLTQVASGNLTATDIKEMMRQMPALPRLLASTETGKELLENGQITTKAVKNYIAKYGSDAILGVFKEISEKSEASDIYETANKTFKGAVEQLREKMVLEWQNAFKDSGASNLVKDILNELSKDGGIIEQVGERVVHYGRIVVDWFKKNEKQITEILNAIGEGLGQIATEAKDTVVEILKTLEVVDGNGKLNVPKFKELISQFTSFIKGIVSGFGSGVKALLGLLDTLRKQFGPEIFEKIGHAIGLLASPMGDFITMLGRMGSNLLRAAGGIVTIMSGLTGKEFLNSAITKTGKWATNLGLGSATGRVPQAIGNVAYTVSGGRVPSGGVATGVSKVASFAGKAVKGAGITALGLGLTEAAKGLADIAGASKEVTSTLGGLGTGITLATAGFTMFGPGGAIIGGILGAVTGFVTEMERQKQKLYQENATKSNEEIEKILSEEGGPAFQQAADDVFAALEAEGVKIDRGTDSGKYAEQMLIKKLDELFYTRDENGKVTATHLDRVMTAMANGDLTKLAAGWYRDQEVKEATANLTKSEKFLTVGGNVIDFEKDTARRDNLAKFIERNWLNGDTSQYDYANSSAETIVRDYLQTIAPNGKEELTDRQYSMLFQTENERSKELEPLLRTAEGVDGLREDLKGMSAWNDISWIAEHTDEYGWDIWQTLKEINQKIVTTNINNGTYGQDSVNAWGGSFITPNTSNAIVSWRQKGSGGRFGGGSDDNKYTNPDGSRSYKGVGLDNRDKMAEVYGKKPDDNDDFQETIDKMNLVAVAIEKSMTENRGDKAKIEELRKDYEQLEKWRDQLQGFTVGDWGALFKLQNEMASLVGKYGITFRASGGVIERLFASRGRGVDTVPAFLQPGEFVMRKSAVEKAGTGVFAALNRGDFATAAHAIGSKFNSSWDNSHHWSNQITTNNNSTTSNYFFAGGQVRGRRAPYRSMANRVATI